MSNFLQRIKNFSETMGGLAIVLIAVVTAIVPLDGIAPTASAITRFTAICLIALAVLYAQWRGRILAASIIVLFNFYFLSGNILFNTLLSFNFPNLFQYLLDFIFFLYFSFVIIAHFVYGNEHVHNVFQSRYLLIWISIIFVYLMPQSGYTLFIALLPIFITFILGMKRTPVLLLIATLLVYTVECITQIITAYQSDNLAYLSYHTIFFAVIGAILLGYQIFAVMRYIQEDID